MKQKDTRSSDEKQMQKDYARDLRKTPDVEKSLRQFLKIESGAGNKSVYVMRHEFTFDWTQEQRDLANALMYAGRTFEEAYHEVKSGEVSTEKGEVP